MPFNVFSSRVNRQAATVARPGDRGNIGEALSPLGRVAADIAATNRRTDQYVAEVDHDIAVREQNRADDETLAKASVELAKAQQDSRVFDAENANSPDYLERRKEKTQELVGRVQSIIGNNPRIAQRMAAPLAEMAAREDADAEILTNQVRAKVEGEAFKQSVETWQNSVSTDPNKLPTARAAIEALVDGNSAIPDAMKPLAKVQAMQPVYTAALHGAIEGGQYDAVEKALNDGTYDAVIGRDDKVSLLSRIKASRNADRIETEHATAVERQTFKESAAAIQTRVKGGELVPVSEIQSAIATAKRLGETNDAAELEQSLVKVAVTKKYGGYSYSQRQTVIGQLKAKVSAGRATREEQLAVQQLEDLQDAKGEDEAGPLRDQFKSGTAGAIAVAGELMTRPVRERYALAEKVDKGFSAYMALPAATRQVALEGRGDVELLSKHFAGRQDEDTFAQAMERSGVALNGEGLAAVRDVANSIYAYRARKANKADFDATLYKQAVSEAFGRRSVNGRDVGGIGTWSGAKVILPDTRSESDFSRMIEAANFTGARVAGNREISRAEVLRNYRPVYIGDSEDGRSALYLWYDSRNRPLGHVDGGAFRMRIKK